MKPKIIAQNKKHLKEIIKGEMELNGNECDLNHIDVSNIENMYAIFAQSEFNGNISKWDVSNVKNMESLFNRSKFNGDISEWNVKNVENMKLMFLSSVFNGDISSWDVSQVKNMRFMFSESKFNSDISKWNVSQVIDMDRIFSFCPFLQDISNWKPYNVQMPLMMFYRCNTPVPYWAYFENKTERKKAIDAYNLNNELNAELSNTNIIKTANPKL